MPWEPKTDYPINVTLALYSIESRGMTGRKTIYSQSCKIPNKCPDVNSAAPTSGFIEFCGNGCSGNRQNRHICT